MAAAQSRELIGKALQAMSMSDKLPKFEENEVTDRSIEDALYVRALRVAAARHAHNGAPVAAGLLF